MSALSTVLDSWWNGYERLSLSADFFCRCCSCRVRFFSLSLASFADGTRLAGLMEASSAVDLVDTWLDTMIDLQDSDCEDGSLDF